MNYVRTSFHNDIIYKITDKNIYNDILKRLQSLIIFWPWKYVDKNFEKGDFYISPKYKGDHYILAFIEFQNNNLAILLDDPGDMFLLEVHIEEIELFRGSVFDCEIMKNTIFIQDCYSINGNLLDKVNFPDKIPYIKHFLGIIHSPLYFVIKEFYSMENSLPMREEYEGLWITDLHSPQRYIWFIQKEIYFNIERKENTILLSHSKKPCFMKMTNPNLLEYLQDTHNIFDKLDFKCSNEDTFFYPLTMSFIFKKGNWIPNDFTDKPVSSESLVNMVTSQNQLLLT